MARYLLIFLLCCTGSLLAEGVPSDVRRNLKAGLENTREKAVREAVKIAGTQAIPLVLPLAAGDRDGRVRDVAFSELCKLRDDDAILAFVKEGLRSRDQAFQRVSAEILGNIRAAGAAEELMPLLKSRDSEVRRAAAWALGQLKAVAALPKLQSVVEGDRDPLVRALAVESISRIGGESVLNSLLGWSDGGDEARKMSALQSLRFHNKDEAARALRDVLMAEEKSEELSPILAQALLEVKNVRERELIVPLIALLDHPRPRTVALAFSGLRNLTGMELPCDRKAWTEWWEYYGPTFKIEDKKEMQSGEVVGSQVSFFGTPIVSDRIVFVIDFSGSMKNEGKSGRPKIDEAIEALRETLESLPKGARFSVISFGDAARAWKEDLVTAKKKTIADALAFLRAAPPRGRTNIYDALDMALGMKGLDTVVLLSDGGPSAGQYEFFSRIRHHLRWRNRLKLAAINSVSLGSSKGANNFLRQLAEDSGGESFEP